MIRPISASLSGIGGCVFVLIAGFWFTFVVQAGDETLNAPSVTVATIDANQGLPAARHPRENSYLKRKWGVEPVFVRQTAGGYMLEFRYRVLDAEKAKPLFERQTKPLLTHAETGAKLVVPTPAKTGALRNSNTPKDGITYWMFFANPGKLVKPGEHVNIEIGDFLVEKLIVQ